MRTTRDILAEAMRRERLGLTRPLWAGLDADSREQTCLRADHLMRLLAHLGVELVQTGDANPAEDIADGIIASNQLAGDPETERVIRKDAGDTWSIVTRKADVETIEQTFTLADVMLNADLVLRDDPAAKAIPGLGRRLAAAFEIMRLCAGSMQGPAT